MYKTDFYTVIIATRDQFNRPIKKQCFRKVSGWGETLEAPEMITAADRLADYILTH
jgi:hypothetical protein